VNDPSDDDLIRMANELGDELDHTDGYATDEHSREKQDGPIGEPESPSNTNSDVND
jgi:hypothetical protein